MSLWRERQPGVVVWPSLGSEPNLIPHGGTAGQGGTTVRTRVSAHAVISSRTFPLLFTGRYEGVLRCHNICWSAISVLKAAFGKKRLLVDLWWELYFTTRCSRKHNYALSNIKTPDCPNVCSMKTRTSVGITHKGTAADVEFRAPAYACVSILLINLTRRPCTEWKISVTVRLLLKRTCWPKTISLFFYQHKLQDPVAWL